MADAPFIELSWITSNFDEVIAQLLEHLQLTAIAVVIGLAISLPLGVYAYRHRRFYAPVTGVAGVLYTIPSLALLALLVPATGLSITTAEIALVSYTLLILIRNIMAGLEGVPADIKESARGMGYSDRQLLWRIEVPLALPVILTGIRLATVTTIGLVTITALIGKGGFGRFILIGLGRFDPTLSFWGAALSLTLAVAADGLLVGAEKIVAPWTRAGRNG